tara:strand:- start:82 stop:393 length:312 start_codon:yes stop_codon:yes gene_type:complete
MEGYSKEDELLINKYEFNCVGQGCLEMTNGSQYCAKTYCQTEQMNQESDSDNNDNNDNNDDDSKEMTEIINYCEYVEEQDQSWLDYENKSGYTRPKNWYVAKK